MHDLQCTCLRDLNGSQRDRAALVRSPQRRFTIIGDDGTCQQV